MRSPRPRGSPLADEEAPPKKPRQSAEIDSPFSDEPAGTPPSPSFAPPPPQDSGASLPPLRRSSRIASASQSRGVVEKPLFWEDDGAGEALLVFAEEEKPKTENLGGGNGRSGRKGRGKRKLDVDTGCLRLRNSVGDSGSVPGSAGDSESGGGSTGQIKSEEKGVGIGGKGKVDECRIVDLFPEANAGAESGSIRRRGKYTAAEKGKRKMVKDDILQSDNGRMIDLNLPPLDPLSQLEQLGQELSNIGRQLEDVANQVKKSKRAVVREKPADVNPEYMRDVFRNFAKENASRFAHFNPNEEVFNNQPVEAAGNANANVVPVEPNPEPEDRPGPFSTAVSIIKDRSAKMSSCLGTTSKKCKSAITWSPNRNGCYRRKYTPPTLMELCLNVLADNADAIASLDGVPDPPRHKLCQILCDKRKMNKRFFDLLVGGSPTELRIKDSSWLAEEEIADSFKDCDTTNLVVLQLDQGGRCLPDYIISSSIARSCKCFPALSTISITGACRITDAGLATLVSSTPDLKSINLSQCSLLTYRSIETLANNLGSVLSELYIDDCQSIEAMLMLPALRKLENLQVLSVGGISSVSDDFVRDFIVLRGHNIRELILTDCVCLTDASIKAIADTCPGLLGLNLSNLMKLTDSSLGYLSSGCQTIEKLVLCRNNFSDEAIAAFLETSGEQLRELSLNNVKMVGSNTAISVSKRAKKLESIDLSFCRNMSDEALGLIVDSCSCLKELRVFGCTQITDTFLNGHSSEEVQIVGLRMAPFLKHCRVSVPQKLLKYI